MSSPSTTRDSNKSTDPKLRARYTNREQWLSQNEMAISDLWEAMGSYLHHNNSFLLDKCDYVTFCDFVGNNSTHFDEK